MLYVNSALRPPVHSADIFAWCITLSIWCYYTQLRQTMRGHEKMILDLCFDKDYQYMFTASVDCNARSWMPDIGDEVRVFGGGTRSVIVVKVKGDIRKWKMDGGGYN